ncbi:AAA family ATPase [Streptococcus oralis]|uniref:AAA family ATPase n=1 Tax=Streptococcus oralis TaxID=1303 RepID=UPI001CBE3423|nr:AAA family ATPase [Streptococcus oralis]MBZ2097161.1 ATP-binding protein [Streptococcus oralis]MBZ2102681.1 ATP-binding protein [Streptococcus oralis]
MKLIALVIKQYNKLFEEQIINFSDEYKVNFDFETNELKIDKNPYYIENFYGESIYNISPIVGINGTGKTTILNLIGTYSPENYQQDPDNQYFFLFEIGKQEDKVRFKVSSNNLSVATLQECWGQTFYRNQDGSFDCDPEYYDDTKNILYVNLQSKGGGTIGYRTTLNQEGLAMFIHSYLWLSDRKIINSVLSCSLEIESHSLKDNTNPIPRGIKAIGFLIYKSIHNIFYEKNEIIKKLLSESIVSKCEKYLTEDVSDYENFGINLLLEIVKELDKNEVKDETRKIRKEYVESIITIVNIFIEIRENGSLIDSNSASILLKYSNNNRSLYEELNDRLFQHTKSKKLVDKFCYDLNENFNNYYLLKETPNYHMSTGEGNLIEIFSQLYSYLLMYEKNDEDIILLVDELETGMHLEWSRRLIKILINNLSEILEDEGKGREIQLIFTTYSPYMLSDIKPGNVIMIEKNQETGYSEGKVLQNTFAKNIQEIMKENLIDNIYGDFALAKINSMIERLNEKEEHEGNEEELLKEIHLISEPILRNKLLEMYDKKYDTSEFSIEKQLQKLNLNEEQRQQVRAMIEANISNADADK